MVDDEGPQFQYFDQQVGPVRILEFFICSSVHDSILRTNPFGSISIIFLVPSINIIFLNKLKYAEVDFVYCGSIFHTS